MLYQQEYPNPTSRITTAIEKLDLDFVLQDMFKILESLKIVSERIEKISTSLRNFSRSDSDLKMPADLHEGLDSTLMILQHRLKGNSDRPSIEVIINYGELPEINCYIGQMNQVFMNILANAIDALDEAIAQEKISDSILQIQITTEVDTEQWAVISIADNGMGIPESIQQRLFEPLFTTKPVGKGTGLGLSIAHQIVVQKHNGELLVNSQLGKGTEFIIKIPIMSATG